MTATADRSVRPHDAEALAELLRARLGRLRLCGSGSRQHRLPIVPGALRVDVSGLATIHRLDAPDQTCTVDCGVTRAQLDDALRPHGLELPCPGDGTMGGLFAADPLGARCPGGLSPRSLLLGCEGLLADGTAFRSGARVVKSVAGFDVHKLLVGSEGRLFAAVRLHLRLKPAPRSRVGFALERLDRDTALAHLSRLRQLAHGLDALHLLRTADSHWSLHGALVGRANFVATTLREQGLPEAAVPRLHHLAAAADHEVLAGHVLPSALPNLLALLPLDAPFLWHGGGRFETVLPDARATDRVLQHLPDAPAAARVVQARHDRLGLGTPIDAGQRRIATALHTALDPDDVFC